MIPKPRNSICNRFLGMFRPLVTRHDGVGSEKRMYISNLK
jgi:hypothetical protein